MITGPLAVAKNTNLLPTVSLGPHRVTRLIVGSNPIRGYSHFNPQYSRQMAEWSTDERVVQLLLDCEKAGSTHFSPVLSAPPAASPRAYAPSGGQIAVDLSHVAHRLTPCR